MTLPYPITAAEVDADSPVKDWPEAVRANLEDHETRLLAVSAAPLQGIYDEFTATAIDTETWDTAINGSGAVALVSTGHYCDLNAGAAGTASWVVVGGTTKRARIILSDAHQLKMRFRLRSSVWCGRFTIGLQDASLAFTSTSVTDTTNFIGIINGTASGKYAAKVNKAGSGTTSADIGTSSAWTVFEFTITNTGTLTVAATMDGVAISGFPVTTNIPNTVTLRPFFGVNGDGSLAGRWFIDRYRLYWSSEPDSAI